MKLTDELQSRLTMTDLAPPNFNNYIVGLQGRYTRTCYDAKPVSDMYASHNALLSGRISQPSVHSKAQHAPLATSENSKCTELHPRHGITQD